MGEGDDDGGSVENLFHAVAFAVVERVHVDVGASQHHDERKRGFRREHACSQRVDAEEEGERAVAVVVGVRENGSEIYRCEMVGRVDHLHDEAERFGVLGDSRAGDRVASSFFEREENHDAGRESGRMVGGLVRLIDGMYI